MKITYAKLFKKLPFLTALRFSLLILIKKMMANEANIYFSQTGEDTVLKFLLREGGNGVYVDIGCNTPIYLSNTFFLYISGWNGICVDANERLCQQYKKARPFDTVVHAAVSDVEKEVTFHISDKVPAVSTIDQQQLEEWKKHWEFNREVKMITQRVETILDKHLPTGTSIDVLSIDVEGHDLNALMSVNLNKYRPRFIVIEIHEFKLSENNDDPIVKYLKDNGYVLEYFSTINGYFRDRRR
jgi:FkbM family methyltransferase